MVIWKHPLKITHLQKVNSFADSIFISTGNQQGNLCLWSMNYAMSKPAERTIEIIQTGDKIPPGDRSFIGTVVIEQHVWHVFELQEDP